MIRSLGAFATIAVLALSSPAQSRPGTVQEQVSALNPGSYVSVETNSGAVIKGRLLSSDSTTLEIKPDGRKATPVSIAFGDIRYLKRLRMTPLGKKMVIVGLVAGGVAATLAIVCTTRSYGCYDQ